MFRVRGSSLEFVGRVFILLSNILAFYQSESPNRDDGPNCVRSSANFLCILILTQKIVQHFSNSFY